MAGAKSDKPSPSGSEALERTTTVFGDEVEADFGSSPSERKRRKGMWFGLGALSLAVVAALVIVMISLPGNSAKKHEAVKQEEAAAAAEKRETGNSASRSGEAISERPRNSGNAFASNAQSLIEQGKQIAADEPEKAAELIERSIGLDSHNAKAYFELGKLQTRLKNYHNAIELYRHAGELDPSYPDTFFNLGFLYAMMKDYSESEEMYKRVAALSPSYLDEVYFNLAEVQKAQGKNGESVMSLERALAVNPGNARALKRMEKLKRE